MTSESHIMKIRQGGGRGTFEVSFSHPSLLYGIRWFLFLRWGLVTEVKSRGQIKPSEV